jgi:hypothetical protein
MAAKLCPHCWTPIPEASRKTYCSTKCRRDHQNERRRDERAEFKEQEERARQTPMADPFNPDFVATLDWWEAAELYANANLDPEPVRLETRYDKIQRSYRALQDKELVKPARMRQGWLI